MTSKDKQDVIAVCNILADKMSDSGKVAVQQIIGAVEDMVENEPCEDCISREALRQKLQDHHDFIVNYYDGLYKPQKYKARVDEINKCIAVVVNAPSVTPQQKWIPVSERLPEEDGDYLVTTKWIGSYSGDVYIETHVAYYRKKPKEWDCVDIIAWMPLPEPYKAESEDKE